jgi:hypothetical protein
MKVNNGTSINHAGVKVKVFFPSVSQETIMPVNIGRVSTVHGVVPKRGNEVNPRESGIVLLSVLKRLNFNGGTGNIDFLHWGASHRILCSGFPVLERNREELR